MRRYLIVANQTLGGQRLLDVVRDRQAAEPSDFYVVVPATPPMDYVLGASAMYGGVLGAEGLVVPMEPVGEEEGQQRARRHLEEALERLEALGVTADGEVGDPDPVEAIEAVRERRPVDEIILSTLPPGISRWLKMDLLHRVERRFDLPVTHVIAEEPATTESS